MGFRNFTRASSTVTRSRESLKGYGPSCSVTRSPMVLYCATSVQYDLVILDVMLPGKDGHAVCRELRNSGFRAPILHGLFPIVSILIFLAAIWLSISPWPAAPLNTFPFIVLAVIVLAIIWSMVLKSQNSPVLKRLGDVLFLDAGQKP